jgi:hypothetical protein
MSTENPLKGLFTLKELTKFTEEDLETEKFARLLLERGRKKAFIFLAKKHKSRYREKKRLFKEYKTDIANTHDYLIQSLVMQIECAQEIGEIFSGHVRKNPKKVPLKEYVVDELYAQCILIANEIYVLITHGFPEGATARWRSLYETSITLNVLLKAQPDISLRYWDFAEVTMFEESKALDKLNPHHRKEATRTRYDSQKQAAKVEKLVQKYGEEFQKPYGWAKPILVGKKLGFAGLEEYAGLTHHQFAYKTSSTKIHAGPMGLRRKLHIPPEEMVPVVGPSNFGLFAPTYNTCLTVWVTANQICLAHQANENVLLQAAMQIIVEDLKEVETKFT